MFAADAARGSPGAASAWAWCDQLRAAGFTGVTMLNDPAQPFDDVELGPQVEAA